MRGAGPRPARRLDLIDHHLVEIPVAGPRAEIVAAELWGSGAVGIEETGTALIVAFDDGALAEAARQRYGGSRRAVDAATGLDAWRDHARVAIAGPFAVHPPWLAPPEGKIALCIDPGHAFGSGSHASTRLALELLATVVEPGQQVVDIGSGSGVLAIAAARLGGWVTAIDIDAAAIAATLHNATVNDVLDRVAIRAASPRNRASAVDIAVANVTIDLHEQLADEVRTLGPARLVVSGLLEGRQEQRAVAAYGGTVGDRLVEGEWVALRLDL